MSKNAAVLLFCGDPRRDSWQKRLPRQFLATIHRSLRQLIGSIHDADLITVSANANRVQLSGSGLEHNEPAGTLAQQIDTSVRFCFDSGYRRVVILAGDVVQLSREVVVDALHVLDQTPRAVVLGRSGDGGFYLAGFNRPSPFDWESIVDRRDHAAETLAIQAQDNGSALTILPTVDDIDDYTDALRLIALRHALITWRALIETLASLLLTTFAAPRRMLPLLESRASFECLRGPPCGIVIV
ncbi:MAG: DUF2064 domain-containing protein [Thermoanaerobaculia bacterium]